MNAFRDAISKFREAHSNSDTDAEPLSIHHTLGRGPNQAAPGNHKHSDYSLISHNHDGVYSPVGHNHDGAYSAIGHNHALSGLSDVVTTGLADTNVLKWDAATSKWKPGVASSAVSLIHRGNSVDQILTTGQVTKVPYDTEVANNGVGDFTWDNTNKQFVCQKTGVFTVVAAFVTTGSTTGQRFIYVMKNGAQSARVGGPPANTTTTSMQIVDVVDCVVGDTIDIRVYQNSGGNLTVAGSTAGNYVKIRS